MSTYTLPYLGEVAIDSPEGYYDAEAVLDGRTIEVDITFEEKTIDVAKLSLVNSWLSDIQRIDRLGLAALQEDFRTGETVQEYIQHHLDELDSDDLKDLLKTAKAGSNKKQKMLSLIRLKRIGFYPDAAERFISLDYKLDEELTDYLIVLDFTEEGKLHYLTTES